jgi:5-methylcytosine-specific restriction endonuclease McrBC regulatory subunit McrC
MQYELRAAEASSLLRVLARTFVRGRERVFALLFERKVKPDILVQDDAGDTVLVIDTKWKVSASPHDDDLKQMFVYNELLEGPRSILLCPRTASSKDVRGTFVDKKHRCDQVHVGCVAGWRTSEVTSQLVQLFTPSEA